ncbi:hypothetical protein GU243_02405 [Pseudarthrobacter psychrotolerans]|uniref:Uncharacterized protein n=1 Tax=Pseudarthrobacter psychrotolerans TaxID=2697569 RepID=A0A6P1NE05_9MICC|nr:hypothetical protein [Pseudarthrobacter psychrotolerans]QHK18815.1 hypothetical protein GU243_02405 [Pseudarthrobacter psychrotolerans]
MDNILTTIARINAGMQAADNNGVVIGKATAQAVVTTLAGPEQDLAAQLRAENVKLVDLLAARDTANAQLTTALDALADD